MKYTVKDRQTVADIALQVCGSVEAVWEICRLNDVALSAELPVGRVLELPTVVDGRLVNYYSVHRLAPATAVTTLPADDLMTIEGDESIVCINTNEVMIKIN